MRMTSRSACGAIGQEGAQYFEVVDSTGVFALYLYYYSLVYWIRWCAQAGVAFLSLNASEFVEMFVGVGASRVRDLFAQAGPPLCNLGCLPCLALLLHACRFALPSWQRARQSPWPHLNPPTA